MAGKTGSEHLFNAATEVETTGALLSNKINIPALLPQGPAKEWLDQRRATIRPWANFVDQRRFAKPQNFGVLCKRLVRNVEYFQSNYVFVFLGLIVYCLITSPLLLIALAVFFGACYIMYLKTQQSQLVLLGRELSTAHQYSLAGAVSFPFFWLAGAGSAVFWVLGATLVVIGSHAAFHELESAETDELQMEPV
ncbi:prenylated Rab acceptor protein 1 [Thamnophis elegans]|uniref:prenylated Rab acceptor protein 1 n=1 Tax=Thamnophis elegans TaxID=35005 RepID=UPI001376FA6F|nr:prenylated Rab acceptor protein 1 [Thamnophis elegans]XP_032084577.1 prenylated Rab acceptor protein 1 [Thamnophis elegans]